MASIDTVQKHFSATFARSRIRLRLGVGIAVVLVVLIGIASAVHLRRIAEQRVTTEIQNMAQSIEQSIESRIDTIDVVLQTSVDEIRRLGAEGRLDRSTVNAFFDRQMHRVPAISYLRVANEHGDILNAPGDSSKPVNIADRDYFLRLRHEPARKQLVNQFVVARTSDRWAWLFVRPLLKPSGAFGGVVIAGMLASDIESSFTRLTLESADVISLRDADMKLIARYAAGSWKHIPTGDRTLSADFAKTLAAHPSEGDYVSGATSLDGIPRVHSYRRNPKYGFLINIGLSTDEAYLAWRKQVGILAGLTAAFVLALLFFARILSQAWQRHEQILSELDAHQTSLEEAQHIARLGRYAYDIRGDSWHSCDILDDIFGIGPAYARNADGWVDLVIPESREQMRRYLQTLIEKRLPFDYEYRIIRPENGEMRWVHGLGKLQFDAEGRPLRLIGTIQDITEQKLLEERLHLEATTDKLTGAANRRRFLDLANNEVVRAHRLGRPLSLAVIDIDHFKEINDSHGHQAGDRALCELAATCRDHVREIDIFARIGGDEFVLLLPEANSANAFETVERVRQALATQSFSYGGRTVSITISCGVAGLEDPPDTLDALISRADRALYAAKRAGRNRSEIGY